ncbi:MULTISPECIES: secretin N-terminal domain-containing protein [Pseudoalteromonas]|uniref:secretin N-terminal domain-containing protein n=1 Tax=Pseudoalteromonas TaxID=53246 RepID=UPI0015843AFE|nr:MULTISPECIES: secretin N-terminal domain-containing protein [Pseudoalteromonas]MDI4652077.1 hypothetical protein [Pseudoalteromonas shioyasakiensis]NUJ38402.1 hypothetical protein [Pseudoalteromonas sp. 0303]
MSTRLNKVHCVRSMSITLLTLTLISCASTEQTPYVIKKSALLHEQSVDEQDSSFTEYEDTIKPTKIEDVGSIARAEHKNTHAKDVIQFKNNDEVLAAFDSLKVEEFIHQVFGEVLKANYVIEDKITKSNETITLNINNAISSRMLYINTKQILSEKGIDIEFKDDTFYVYQIAKKNSKIISNVGRTAESVPAYNGEILQIIPLKYGVNISLERTIKQLSKAQVSADPEQSTVFVKGMRDEVLQVIDLIDILDRPAHQGKHIGFLQLNYIPIEEFIKTVKELLDSEGVPTGMKVSGQRNLALIPLHQIGAVAIFASEQEFLDRVEFWAKKLDKAPSGDTKQYFIYRPKFARAQDLGESLAPLFGNLANTSNKAGNTSRDTQSAVANKVDLNKNNKRMGNEEINIVIDKRANFVIVHSTGREYQAILPLIKNLDVMPKQILLEATIAEVTLRDEFEYGVEYFLEDGKFTLSTQGALGLNDIAGGVLNIAGSVSSLQAKFIQRNNLVNILSNPTLLVRDGTAATITVGDEIPIVTSTDTNDETNVVRTNVQRRQTGVTLAVTPTINTEGVVIMEIEQKISNQVAGSDQSILNREIKTEVVANSGSTILLGGLISENNSDIDTQVPVLGDIPLIGNLFKGKSNAKSKTELVILVTPRVIYDQNQWINIKENFKKGVENIDF